MGLEEAGGKEGGGLDTLTGGAGLDVGVDGARESRPVEEGTEGVHGLGVAGVAGGRCIVKLGQ
jgi:hypothetical protein